MPDKDMLQTGYRNTASQVVVTGSHWCCRATTVFAKHSHISHSTSSAQTQNKQGCLQPEVQLTVLPTHQPSILSVSDLLQAAEHLSVPLEPSATLQLPSPASQRASSQHTSTPQSNPPHSSHLTSMPLAIKNPHSIQSPHPPPASNSTAEKLLECSVPPRWWQSGLVSSSQAGTGAPEAQNEG